MTMPFTIAFGLFFAYLLYHKVRGAGIYRTIYFLPYVISTVGSSIVWAWVFDPASGLANIVLRGIGLQPLRWLIEPTGVVEIMAEQLHWTLPTWAQGPSLTLVAIAIFSVWQLTATANATADAQCASAAFYFSGFGFFPRRSLNRS